MEQNAKSSSIHDQIRKATGGRALLDYSENPAFISFRQLSVAAANASVKKLLANGYKAIRFENFVKIELTKPTTGQ